MPTPPEPGEPYDRPVLEPIRVLRPRRTDALADLFREMTQDAAYESVPVRDAPAEEETQELPPFHDRAAPGNGGLRDRPAPGSGGPGRRGEGRGDGLWQRRAAVALGVCAAALVGFAGALLLPRMNDATAAAPAPSASAPAPTAAASTDPDGAGTLREGDSGPEVTDLQQRLLRIPNVYDHGATDGSYGADLTAAVARFQLWYGIRGDESGVYGDDTRRDLEARTSGG
ncbi:peptidoglycan-binding protein [Streptomyces adustus]|uniref:Peptidoglycan-binding protein n=1 Tax=Streptomyces adustus TaxID=1609272 RepID=A0A5N8VE13_9ACTN|nr:peptidoglycan-binding protein [Streptomyces adustus]